jgi:hypothetical protein
MKKLLMICTALAFVSCSHNGKDAGLSKDKKIIIEAMDVQIDGPNLKIPIKVRCIEGYTSATLQIGDVYKTLVCENGGFNYMHSIPTKALRGNRSKKKDYVLRIRGFHEEKKSETLTQSLIIISNKDFQSKLVINQSLVMIEKMGGIFSDLHAYGQCKSGSTVEVEIFDDWRGVSLEEESIPCSETGFNYVSRRPGTMKKGMRLLIREMKGKRPVSSFEVLLFN